MSKCKKTFWLLLLCLALVTLFAACAAGNGEVQPDAGEANDGETAAEGTVTFTDSCGRELTVDAEITRIVPTGPMAQMVLLTIAPDLMAGIATPWDDAQKAYIDEAYWDIPVLGQLYGGKGSMNLEEIAAIDAQVVIDVGEAKDSIVEDMDGLTQQLGIPAVHIEASLADMATTFRLLGQLLNREEKGEELAAYCEEVYNRSQEIMEQVGEDKVSMIYCLGDAGLNVLAKDSYHAELLDMLADNAAVVENPSSKGTGDEVDMEQLLVWDPQVIVFSNDSVYDQVGDDAAWQQLQAIADGNYYETPCGPYNWMCNPPSVNRYLGLIWLPSLLYPQYADYDLYTEVAKFYEMFYGHTLTEEEFAELTANAVPAEEAAA
ncbi:MAG: ABC transporter substrate-binding protein [Firmicutes bacterium]|nr:ABC transporter substrate-binding protein [Bacillota bacterium]